MGGGRGGGKGTSHQLFACEQAFSCFELQPSHPDERTGVTAVLSLSARGAKSKLLCASLCPYSNYHSLLPYPTPTNRLPEHVPEARRVFAFASHGLFNGPANKRLAESELCEVSRATVVMGKVAGPWFVKC